MTDFGCVPENAIPPGLMAFPLKKVFSSMFGKQFVHILGRLDSSLAKIYNPLSTKPFKCKPACQTCFLLFFCLVYLRVPHLSSLV